MTADILRIAGNGNGANLRRVFYDGVEVTGYPDTATEIHRLLGQGVERLWLGTLQSVTIQNNRTGKGCVVSLTGAPGALQLFIHESEKP